MAAPTNTALVKKALANSEPSTVIDRSSKEIWFNGYKMKTRPALTGSGEFEFS
jgi:hypothetical protein